MAQNSITFTISDDAKVLLDNIDPIFHDTALNIAIKLLSRNEIYNSFLRMEKTLPKEIKEEIQNKVDSPEPESKPSTGDSPSNKSSNQTQEIDWSGDIF